jgi:hypothetical protein
MLHYSTYAINRLRCFWGPDADEFRSVSALRQAPRMCCMNWGDLPLRSATLWQAQGYTPPCAWLAEAETAACPTHHHSLSCPPRKARALV